MRVAPTIVLSDLDRLELARASKGKSGSQRLKLRAQIILLAADGLENKEIAARLAISPFTVNQYNKSIYRRFGVQSRATLIAKLLRSARTETR